MSGKCLKEYANNDCYISELKYEKSKLHIRYLLAIAIGLILLSVLIVTKGGVEFANQLSMGSTISSIILSAIAIFMSISGENKTSSIQNQMIETSTKMSKIVNQIENANEKTYNSVTEKLKAMDALVETLKGIGGDMKEVKGKLQDMSSVFVAKANDEKNYLNKENIYKLYLCFIGSQKEKTVKLFRKTMLLLIILGEKKPQNAKDLYMDFLNKSIKQDVERGAYFGTFSLMGMAGFKVYNDEVRNYLKEKLAPSVEELKEIDEIIEV